MFEDNKSKLTKKKVALVIITIPFVIISIAFGLEFLERHYVYTKARGYKNYKMPFRDTVFNIYFRLPFVKENNGLEKSKLYVHEIKINERPLERLEVTRKKVLAAEYKFGIKREYEDIKYNLEGQWVDAKLKLRGMTALHYTKSRPSVRIKFKGNNAYKGIREFNLLDPYDKGITSDIVTAEYLEKHGLLINPSRFALFKMNNRIVGLFQEYYQFGRSILDAKRRPEGHIFDGEGKHYGKQDGLLPKAKEAVDLLKQCKLNKKCPENFIDDYFQIEKLAKALAMTTLLSSKHAWADVNFKVYYDPARGRFEPIPWDYSYYKLVGNPKEFNFYKDTYAEAFMSDERLKKLHDMYLWDMLADVKSMLDHSTSLFNMLKTDLKNDNRHFDFYRDQKLHDEFQSFLKSNEIKVRKEYFNNTAPKHYEIKDLFKKTSRIKVIAKDTVIKKNMVIPYGATLKIEKGVDLRISKGVSIYVYGDLLVEGTKNKPIYIGGYKTSDWGSLVVQGRPGSKSKVILNHVTLEGGLGTEDKRGFFTSSISIHDANIEVDSAKFLNIKADDGINFKYCNLIYKNSYMSHTKDDGMDLDFCTATISKSKFDNIGGDCLDFSGSKVEITDVNARLCNDKGISIGENTKANVQNVTISDVTTGAAIKDKSVAVIHDISITNAKIGFSAYVKKATFGPSRSKVTSYRLKNVEVESVKTNNSKIELISL